MFNCSYLYILCFLTFSLSLKAQDEENVSKESSRRFFTYQISIVKPVAFGDNFADNGLKQLVGYDLSLRFYIFRSIFLGVEGGSFIATVENEDLVGDFDQSNANTYGLTAGYTFQLNKNHLVDAGLSYGAVNYRNSKDGLDDRFVDSGNYLKINGQYNYRINKNISVFAFTNLRLDRLDIKTSPNIDSFINQSNYVIFGIGFKIGLSARIDEIW